MKPVLRSWEESPAIEAAMATDVPTMSAVALPARSVHPSSRKTALVPSSVAIAMPDVGLEVTPTRPTILELTVTKKKAKIAMSREAIARTGIESMKPRMPGTIVRTSRIATSQKRIVRNDRSRFVRSTAAAEAPAEMWPTPSRKDSTIVGIDLMRVTIPPVATAPAPI